MGSLAKKGNYEPELEEADDDEGIESAGLNDFILRDAESPGDPGDGGGEAAEGKGWLKGDAAMLAQAASVVERSGGGLLLEDGEEGEHHKGQAYIDGGRSEKRPRLHRSIRDVSTEVRTEILREGRQLVGGGARWWWGSEREW